MNSIIPPVVLAALITANVAQGQNIDFEHDGLTRQYRIHIPDQVESSAPLVMVLHGYSGNNNEMMNNYGWTQLADEMGFVAVFPNGTRDQSNYRFWNVGYDFHQGIQVDDDGFLTALAVHLQGLHDLSEEHTFVTGFSNGAEMCFQLACRESETFAAFAPIIGMMLDHLFTNCTPAVNRPILSMNGTADGVTLYQGDLSNSGGWGPYHSIPAMMAFWRNTLDAPNVERTYIPDTDPNDGSTVRLDVYSSDVHRNFLKYYLVIGGGHDWPGQWGNMDIDATREVWDFFVEVMNPPTNPADVNGDGTVNGADLTIILGHWGGTSPACDLDGSGLVDGADMTIVLGSWNSNGGTP
jgi:polyhydroxybutyrate depolymerase